MWIPYIFSVVSGFEVLNWLVCNFSLCTFKTLFFVFRKLIPSRLSTPSSAVITSFCSSEFNSTNCVTLPHIFTAEFLAVDDARFVYVWTLQGFPSLWYMDQLKSDILLPLSISPKHLFRWSMISFGHFIVFVEQTLMTLQFSVVFFWKEQFSFKCWGLSHRKQYRQFLDMCPCPPPLVDGLSCPEDLSLWLGPSIGKLRLSLNPLFGCPLSLLSSSHGPRELFSSLNCFQQISRCLSFTDSCFNSLVTASTKSFFFHPVL